MIASVARDSGRSVADVGGESYALTLWAFLQGEDSKHLATLVAEKEQIELAELVALGFHEPKRIANEWMKWRAKIGGLESADVVREKAMELMARHDAALRRNPLPES